MNNREFATSVVEHLRTAGYTALFAGGCVRDLLLGREPKDFDVATTATPEQVRALFGKKRTLAVGANFGVIIVLGPEDAGQVEVATFRTEGPYQDGRRPSSVAFCTPEEDAKRRDFTINGMFYDPVTAEVFDYVGGERDLAAGVIRAIGNPHDRVREDKLRMLRAIRFAANLDFQLDPVTAAAITEMAADIRVVSAERIAQELKKMLVHRHRRRAMELAAETGLLEASLGLKEARSHRESSPCSSLQQLHSSWAYPSPQTFEMLHLLPEGEFELALAALLHQLATPEDVRDFCKRLKLSNQETQRTAWLVQQHTQLEGAATWPLSRLKRLLAHPDQGLLLQLARVRCLVYLSDLHPVLFCEEFIARTPSQILNPLPLVNGNDLIGLGLKPGRPFSQLLEVIRDAQLNEEIATQDEALRLAKTWILAHSAPLSEHS